MLKAGEEGGADSTTEAIIAQARGTDSGPSEAASPTPADGAPTSDEGWNGHATRGWVPRMFTPTTIFLPSPGTRNALSPFQQSIHIELRLNARRTRQAGRRQPA